MTNSDINIGDLASLRNISVGEFLSLEEELREHYHLHYGELGVINWVDDTLVRIAYVRNIIEVPIDLINVEFKYE